MARQKTDKGTHYEPRKTEQRSYSLPPGLGDAFKNFNQGNGSTGARGAMIAWMALEDFPEIRERAVSAAQNTEIAEAVATIKKLLMDAVAQKALRDWAKNLPEAERAKLLAQALSGGPKP